MAEIPSIVVNPVAFQIGLLQLFSILSIPSSRRFYVINKPAIHLEMVGI